MIKDFGKPILILFVLLCISSIALIMNKKTDNSFIESQKVTFYIDETLDNAVNIELKQDNVVIKQGEDVNADLFPDCYFVLLIDNVDGTVYAAKNVHKRMYPASMTKLMTAIVVCDYMEAQGKEYDEIVTVDNYYDLSAQGGGVNPLPRGSKISVRNLLAGLLIQSNNYYALILADYVAGSEEAFCDLMNEKATALGATNTHFANPHGLDDVEHYSTAYDIYLIIKEASQYPIVNELDSMTEYTYTYENYSGYEIEATISPTNLFLGDNLNLPANYVIKNWKTGTTDGAGSCLAMIVENTALDTENSYTVIASNGESKPQLYDAIVKLICLIK